MTADYHPHGAVAVIALNNPPVNGLGLATRTAVVAALERALADDAVRAIVIAGAGNVFSGGADIREFNSPRAVTEPSLHTMIRLIEQSAKPVVAAIHGGCMGGGLETALACHYRVAVAGAQVALPEVKIGLLPGAGGTQRLPRAIGLETAVRMIVSGEPMLSEQLAAAGLFDRMIEGELLPGAIAFAAGIAALRPLPKVRERAVAHPDWQALLQGARDAVRRKSAHFPAPLKCIDAIEAAITMPFDAGAAYERDLFMQLLRTTESKALRHAFFAERAAGKVPGLAPDAAVRTIRAVAVIGAGTMGRGIAIAFLDAGLPVMLLEATQAALDAGIGAIRRHYDQAIVKGRLDAAQLAQRMALLGGTLSFADLAAADLAIEAVFEEMDLKQDVMRELDRAMRPGAILATNTSTLDIDRIAQATARPQDVIGMHFFSPANVMKLLEVVRGARTGDDVLASAMALAKRIGKTAVVAGACDGFIGNRMLAQYSRQAGYLLEEGCLPQQVDRAIEQFGFAMGPFRMADLAGNDIGWAIRKRRRLEPPGIADRLCEMGRFGQKTGAGWYDYAPGDRSARPSPTVDDMVLQHAARTGIERRAIEDSEIVARLVYALVNEGADILQERIAHRASDIDIVYLAGYGFPLFRGGPMFYADTVGLPNVAAAIESFARGRNGQAWRISPLLARLANEGGSFN